MRKESGNRIFEDRLVPQPSHERKIPNFSIDYSFKVNKFAEVEHALSVPKPDYVNIYRKLIQTSFDSTSMYEYRFGRLLDKIILDKRGVIDMDRVDTLSQLFGFEPGEINKTWDASMRDEKDDYQRTDFFGGNFHNMSYLENERPGSVKFLSEAYGIKNFGRYPYEMLLDQYDRRNDTERPYGVLMYATHDYSGAFYNSLIFLGKLWKILGRDYNLVISEVSTKKDIYILGDRLRERYQERRASFGVLSGHADWSGVDLGGKDQKGGVLVIKDLPNLSIGKFGEIFEDNAQFILNGCNAGVAGGFAEKLSNRWGIQVFASDEDAYINNVRIKKRKNGTLHFDVHYHKLITKDNGDIVDKRIAAKYFLGRRNRQEGFTQ